MQQTGAMLVLAGLLLSGRRWALSAMAIPRRW